jgi:hypothetical protein
MKPALIICCSLLLCACTAPGQVGLNTPDAKLENYPQSFQDSPERQSAVREEWKKLLASFNVPESTIELEPLISTPRALPLDVVGRINIVKRSGPFGEIEAKDALRTFIDRFRGLLGGDPRGNSVGSIGLRDISLTRFTTEGDLYRAVYQQTSYPFPIAPGYGELSFAVSKRGALLQMASNLIPVIDLPTKPEIAQQKVIADVMDREFSTAAVAGQPLTVKATQPGEVRVRDLVVYPKKTGNQMSIHLAYPVEIGKTPGLTVYIDAINGRELGVKSPGA